MMLETPVVERESRSRKRYDRGTNTDGPGTVGAVLIRGLADWIGVD